MRRVLNKKKKKKTNFHSASQQTTSYQHHNVTLTLIWRPIDGACHPGWWRAITIYWQFILTRVRIILKKACCRAYWFCTCSVFIRIVTPPAHKTIYSDHFIWYEKAFPTCPMDLVSKWNSGFCHFLQVRPASYDERRHMTHWWEIGGSLAASLYAVLPGLIR